MDFAKCKTCGERHRAGPCPKFQSSRGGGESRPAGTRDRPAEPSRAVTRAAPDVATNRGKASQARERKDAGLAPGTRGAKLERSSAVEQAAVNRQVGGSIPPTPAKSPARRQAVKASGFGPDIGGSNPPAPAKDPRGRPRKEITKDVSGPRPWEKLGMSERTWWRRQAEARGKK